MAIMSDYVAVAGQLKMNGNKHLDIRDQKIGKVIASGFSLTELLISIAIVGILVSFGYPAYTSHMASAARSAAQADLMAMAAGMERHKASNFSYNGAASGGGNTGSPGFFNDWSPSTEPSANKHYDLRISTVSAAGTSYLLTATPVSGRSAEGNGILYYYSDGRKAWDVNNNGSLSSSEYCWVC